MRHLGLALLTSALIPTAVSAAETYTVDPAHSQAIFRITHLGVGAFWGIFYKVDGTITLDEAKPGDCRVALTVHSSSIFTADKKRDDHLKGPDFLNAKEFPELRFEATSCQPAGQRWTLRGNLTIRGTTRPVVAEVEKVGAGKDPWGSHRAGWEARLTIQRSEYGVSFMPGGLGEEVRLILAVEGIRK